MIQQTLSQLRELRLSVMANAFEDGAPNNSLTIGEMGHTTTNTLDASFDNEFRR